MQLTTPAPISQNTIDLLIPYQTLHTKLRFWLSYLHEILPEHITLYIDDEGNAHNHILSIKRGTTQVRIHIQHNDQTIMRGIIHTCKAKEDAYKTIMVEQTLDDRIPEPKAFFAADKSLGFYTWDNGDCGWKTYRKPEKNFDPITDVDAVRSYFTKALEAVPGMSREEYVEWEREVGIDDEAMAKKDGNWTSDEFVPVEEWPREWFRGGTFEGNGL